MLANGSPDEIKNDKRVIDAYLAVSHDYFVKVGESKLKLKLKKNGVFFDLKNVFPKNNKNLYI